jgi:AraC-like DNA-binding protein
MTVAIKNPNVLPMSEQLKRVELNFDNVIIHSRLYQFEKKVHDSGLSIKLGHKGEEHYYIGNQKYSVAPGKYLLVNRHQSFDCYLNASQAVEAFCLYLSKDTIVETAHCLNTKQDHLLSELYSSKAEEPVFFEKVYRTDEDMLGQFLENLRPVLESGQLFDLDNFFYTLAEHLLISQAQVHQQINRIDAARRSTREELYRRLSIAKSYIFDHYKKDIQLEELSKVAMLSKYHLLRSYRQAFGITPYRQVLDLRLKEATTLLSQGMTLEKIAMHLGFSDRRSFTKAFKKVYGIAPSTYRTEPFIK